MKSKLFYKIRMRITLRFLMVLKNRYYINAMKGLELAKLNNTDPDDMLTNDIVICHTLEFIILKLKLNMAIDKLNKLSK